jgi:hypothetical protein
MYLSSFYQLLLNRGIDIVQTGSLFRGQKKEKGMITTDGQGD